MLKKIIPIILALCLVFSISAMAEYEGAASDNNNSQPMQEMPIQNGERPQDGQQGTPPEMANGERLQGGNRGGRMPQDEFAPSQNTETNNNEVAIPQNENNQDVNDIPENNTQNPDDASEQNGQQNRHFPGDMQGGFPGSMQNNNQQNQEAEPMTFGSFMKTYSTPITSVILLALAFVFVIFYKKRNY